MKSNEQDRFDAWVARAKTLRAASDEARHALFSHLAEGEAQPEIWSGTGFSFDQLIEHAGLAKGSEYRAWKAGRKKLVDAVGEDRAHRISFEVTKHVAPLQRIADVVEAAKRDEAFTASNGVPPSPTSAHGIVRTIRVAGAAARNRSRSQADMEREIDSLRAKVATLTEENRTLRAENKALRADLRAAKKKAPTSGRKSKVA